MLQTENTPTGLAKYMPILGWLPRYQPAWLRFDLVAGLTAAAVVIPQAMAYAAIAGLPIQVGLYPDLATAPDQASASAPGSRSCRYPGLGPDVLYWLTRFTILVQVTDK